MSYLIDGHNVIGQMRSIRLDDPHDEAKLVLKLMSVCARTGKRCVVVFDGGLPGGWSHLSTSPVEVVFAAGHTNADRIMMERIRSARDPGQWIVVSGDREVLAAANARRMATVRSADFARQIDEAAGGTKQRRKPDRALDAGALPDPKITPAEVAYWLSQFGEVPVSPVNPKRKKGG